MCMLQITAVKFLYFYLLTDIDNNRQIIVGRKRSMSL